MMQTRKQTLVEVVCSTFFAFLLSAALQEFIVAPLWHLHTSAAGNISITLFYTAVSLVRSYQQRRFFNWLHRSKS